MSWRRSMAVVRHDLRILRSDPVFLVMMIGMPLVLMAFTEPVFSAEHAVPGMAVMFSLFLVGNLGFSVFREHGWCTWERLRASCASAPEIMIGKAITPLGMLAVQLGVLFALGSILFGLEVRGSVLALVVLAATYALCLLALGAVALAVCRSVMQLNAFTNLGAMLFAGLGGALAPIPDLPAWARTIAPVTPSYWAMRGFRDVILDGEGLAAVALPAGVLLVAAATLIAVASWRFRFEETKLGWA
jgi:ABC-2 type transport system permease protein